MRVPSSLPCQLVVGSIARHVGRRKRSRSAHNRRRQSLRGVPMNGQQRELTLRFLAEPADVNYGGKVHGGVVMKWIDQAGYAAAVAWSGHYSVTVAVGGIRFVAPVWMSALMTAAVKLVHTGSSSVHFLVEVSARDPMQAPEQDRFCTHWVIVLVALDQAEGRPMAVPTWTPLDDEDRSLHEYAQQVMALSKGIEQT